MKKKIFYFAPIAVVATGLLLMFFLFSFKAESPKQSPDIKKKTVEAIVVEKKNNSANIEAFGRLVSSAPILLISEAEGTIIKGDVPFQPGQQFSKGDTLVKVDNRQIILDINTSKSDFMNAIATILPEIKIDFPTDYELWLNYFSRIDFRSKIEELPQTSNQKIKIFLTRFNVFKLYFAIKKLEIRLEKYSIVADFNGTIKSTQLRVGSTVRIGSQFGEILNMDDMEVEVTIPTIDFSWLEKGELVTLTSEQLEGVWQGRIKRIGASLNEETQSIPLYVGLTSKGKNLFSGSFWHVLLPGKKIYNSTVIPRKAIYNDNYVYTIRNGVLKLREVKIARREKFNVLVESGLETGDTLVTEIMQGVVDGMPAIPIIKNGEEN